MHHSLRTFLVLLLPITILGTSCNNNQDECHDVITKVRSITSEEFGDFDFAIPFHELGDAGFHYMDLIDITFNGLNIDENGIPKVDKDKNYKFAELPFVTNYNEVGYFAPCLCNYQNANDYVEFAPGMHAIKNHAKEVYDLRDQFTVTFHLAERAGYKEMDDLVSCSKKLTFAQADYLEDKFANVRDVTRVSELRSKMKPGVYIRGSSPFDPAHNDNSDGRHKCADNLLAEYHVTNEISLATDNLNWVDKKDKTPPWEGYTLAHLMNSLPHSNGDKYFNTVYLYDGINPSLSDDHQGSAECRIGNDVNGGGITPWDDDDVDGNCTFFSTSMGSDYFTTRRPDSNDKLEGGDITRCVLKYFAKVIQKAKEKGDNPPVFYLHCNEGKDRTGFFSFLIEALCGATFNDVVRDFMLTFTNYYHKFSRYDEESIKMYDAMKLQTIYRYAYAITLDNPAIDLSKVNWMEFDITSDLREKGLYEVGDGEGDHTGEKLQEYVLKYLEKIGFKNASTKQNPEINLIHDYFAKHEWSK